ncbi:hypothetical protein MMC13_005356 [Lambiella insularis]|nr:hypothetical protein [Lambiella insularis]
MNGTTSKPQPLGPTINTTLATLPNHTTLSGRLVTLVPTSTNHADDLFSVAGGPCNSALWTYMLDGPFPQLSDFHAYIARISTSVDPLFFTIISNDNLKPVGHVSLMRHDFKNRVIEIGNVLFSSELQRTPAATEAVYLLTRQVFEWGYRRYEWKCNALNGPSRRAAVRFGFKFEGVFRQHMIVKGRSRDTAWFSMLDDGEWDGVRKGMEKWLEKGNFDANGEQKVKLEAMRARFSDGG